MTYEKEVVGWWPDPVEPGVKELVRELDGFLNSFNTPKAREQVVHYFTKIEHRTLQQNMMRLVYLWISEQADNKHTGNFDLRNQGTIEWCDEATHRVSLPNLPFI